VLGASVARESAESFRKALAARRIVDKTHAIIEDGNMILLPLTAPAPADVLLQYHANAVEARFPERGHMTPPIDDVRRIADIPERLRSLLPGGWERFGDVAVLKLPKELDGFEKEVGEAYASVLGLKAVLRETSGISGEFRRPSTRKIFGGDTLVTHVENHIVFRFDASEIMFSSGNQEERLRMAGLRCDGETVVDMFAGIGYFSLPLAVYQKPKRIVSCEINPTAHSFLSQNIRLNHVEDKVEPVLGDNRELPGKEIADRVIMGYVKTTHLFLPTAIRLLKSGGVLHYHETCPEELIPDRPLKRIAEAAVGYNVQVLRLKQIKSYAPGVDHVVVDARILKSS